MRIVRDITDHKKAEETLMASENYLEEILNSILTGVVVLDEKTHEIVDANPNALETIGASKEHVIGKVCHRFICPAEKGKCPISDLGQTVDKSERVLLRANGERIPILKTVTTTMWRGHKYLIESFIDITERKKAEEELRRSRKEYVAVTNLTGDITVRVDKEGRLTFLNDGACKFWGKPRKKLLGVEFADYLHPDDAEKTNVAIQKMIKTKQMRGVTNRQKTPKGWRTVEWNGTPIFDEAGNYAGMQATGRDITKRKAMEKKLQEYAEHLEEMVEERTRELRESQERLLKAERMAAIGELATMVGHDLRNPLQSIENATYYLNNELPRLLPSILTSQKAMKMLQVISDSVDYADKIVRDLQDFSATKKPILMKTDVNAIVRETLSQVEAPENVEIITELGHLPLIEADKDMIKRVFMNLATNGIQAMKNGGKLKASTKKTKEFVEVSFKDTGIGMSKENMKKLFTPFFTTKAKGIGMGLAICKKFVESHGGSIEVESEEGKGTTFTVKLPIQ